MGFPKNFVWGASAASYQIEGAALEDGKGFSVWDMYCRKGNTIWSNHNGDIACDHYHRYKEDVALMKSLGLKAYRLSIAWPRILPAGIGAINEKGLEFYDRLIDELLRAEIEPYVTLFHWDYPYELYCRGGWLSPQSPDWFAEYTAAVINRLSDRVKHWIPMNEPQCFIGTGLQMGAQAPGDKLGFSEILRAMHNVLLAHGKSVQAIRANSKSKCRIGTAFATRVFAPENLDSANLEAARMETFGLFEKDGWPTAWWMDPLYLGRYPEDGLKAYKEYLPAMGPNDLRTIYQPLDFVGLNNYGVGTVRMGQNGRPERIPFGVGHAMTAYRWHITPDCLYWCARLMHERYKLPIVITENGMSNIEWISLDGKVHDPQRIDFTHRHLKGLQRAAEDGIDIAGYFHWSIMDNFEWGDGYRERFGLIFIDYPTQKRIPKDSAYWYKDVIATNGANL